MLLKYNLGSSEVKFGTFWWQIWDLLGGPWTPLVPFLVALINSTRVKLTPKKVCWWMGEKWLLCQSVSTLRHTHTDSKWTQSLTIKRYIINNVFMVINKEAQILPCDLSLCQTLQPKTSTVVLLFWIEPDLEECPTFLCTNSTPYTIIY